MSTLKRKADGQAGAEVKKPKQDASIMSFFGGGTPKAQGASGDQPAASKFDKQKWVSRLTEEQRELLDLEISTLHESWLSVLKDELVTREFLELKRFLQRETQAGRHWYPPQKDVYSWSRHTPLNTVKVVIIGQDPYHGAGQAHGLAFSVRPPTPAPPSLKNMYTCLKNDYPGTFAPPPRNGGLLVPWAERGVLMLNTCLTVRAREANSHANRGWERFTQKAIDAVAARRTRGVVFMAWGTPASKRVYKVDAARHLILRSAHPSPLSAHRGFFDCAHFRQANDWLVRRYGADAEIDWALAPGSSTLKRQAEDEKPVAAPEPSKDGVPKKAAATNGDAGGVEAKKAIKTEDKEAVVSETKEVAVTEIKEAVVLEAKKEESDAESEKANESKDAVKNGDATDVERKEESPQNEANSGSEEAKA